MFCSAFLEAARVLNRQDCRDFALKTLERILAEAWSDERGFAHRLGGPWLDGALDDYIFTAGALLDAWEATLDPRWYQAAERATAFAVENFYDHEHGAFFDRAKNAPPLGGLDVRRKPVQDSPTPAGNAAAAVVLDRLHAFSGRAIYRDCAQQTLEAFAGVIGQYGLFAASYGLAAALHAQHPIQVVATGAAGDAAAQTLARAAAGVFRFGKAVLRVTPEALAATPLPPALAETLPHLRADVAQALVCVGASCLPPISDPEKLAAVLNDGAASAAR
jgi:hypothetical protein